MGLFEGAAEAGWAAQLTARVPPAGLRCEGPSPACGGPQCGWTGLQGLACRLPDRSGLLDAVLHFQQPMLQLPPAVTVAFRAAIAGHGVMSAASAAGCLDS